MWHLSLRPFDDGSQRIPGSATLTGAVSLATVRRLASGNVLHMCETLFFGDAT